MFPRRTRARKANPAARNRVDLASDWLRFRERIIGPPRKLASFGKNDFFAGGMANRACVETSRERFVWRIAFRKYTLFALIRQGSLVWLGPLKPGVALACQRKKV
ncbi:MAG TPA: hypothetical protein VIJ42_16480 [Stellaceae bacterium]